MRVYDFMNILIETLFILVVLISFLGLGESLRIIFRLNPFASYHSCLIGAGLYSFIVASFGLFFGLKMITVLMLLFGHFVFWTCLYKKQIKWMDDVTLSKQTLIYFFFCSMIAFYPSTYFDPLNYHLVGILKWADANMLIHFPSAIPLMHNSFADYLYFPFALFMPGDGANRLVSIQVCSQLITMILGIVSFSLMFSSLFKGVISKNWMPFFILALLTRASLQHKSLMAKNDWIALSWFLLSIKVILENEFSNKKDLFIGYFMLGLSVGTKLSYIVPSLIFGLSFLATTSLNRLKVHLIGISIFLIAITPYFARNWLWTNNPIFPQGSSFFLNNFLGPSWLEGMELFFFGKGDLSWSFLKIKMLRIFSYEPLCYFSFVPFFYFSTFSKRTRCLMLGFVAFLILFVLRLGTFSEMRFFGPCALAVNFLGGYGIYLLSANFKFLENKQQGLRVLFSSFIVFNILTLENQLNPLPSAVRSGVFLPREQSLVNEKRGIYFAEDIRKTIGSNEKIAIIDDTPLFYFSSLNVIRVWDDPVIDTELDQCKMIDCVIKVLKAHNIIYLIESSTSFDPYYRLGIKEALLKLIETDPKNYVITSLEGNLISVAALAEKIPL